MKTCTGCGMEGGLSDFARWDLLCHGCRAEAGPPKRLRPDVGERPPVVVQTKPKPSGRRAVPREERAVVTF